MIILNDKRFCNETFYYANNIDDIHNSPNNSTIVFDYKEENLSIYKFCKDNLINYAIEIKSISEFIFVSNLKAKYAFCSNLELAKQLQKIADNYLLETKVILKSSINDIENIALNEIDGIFVI